METIRKRLLYLVVSFTFGQLLIRATPVAAQGNCQLVFDAMNKAFDTPSHSYVTTNMGGTTLTGEVIYETFEMGFLQTLQVVASRTWRPREERNHGTLY
jgi:hypothetical protein